MVVPAFLVRFEHDTGCPESGKCEGVLHLEDVRKTYHAGSFTQAALAGVTITFRDNEFVAILGPSGSGKTTLLNVVGGLDHADEGDLIIDQVSTSEYKDRDWDAYRNNRIGFVFQSYNLIPHQSVLANVELALTLTGVAAAERKQRAKAALEQVGLTEHIHKLPNQLSGGQMQRVAIARALINDPEIVLADEPTGALDSTTGTQVMGLLKGIAQDRLVVMVTHNPDLAKRYATRIVSLSDGVVVADTRPYDPGDDAREAKPARRTSMSFLTAIALSFRNLMTKKGRTLMTSFAGSIGIVGIATILALANGVNAYIAGVEENTLSLYPLTIQTQGIDLTSLLTNGGGNSSDGSAPAGQAHANNQMAQMFSHIGTNDLASLKTFLDSPSSGITPYVNAIDYGYNITPQIFAADTSNGVRQVNPNKVFAALGMGGSSDSALASSFPFGMSADSFSELPSDLDLVRGQYDMVAGDWPTSPDEGLLVLSSSGGVSDYILYTMGLRNPDDLAKMVQGLASGTPFTVPDYGQQTFTYEQLMGVGFTVVPATAFYEYDPAYQVWTDRSGDAAWLKQALSRGMPLRIVGIAKPNPAATATMLSPGLYYPASLIAALMNQAASSSVVRDQLATPDINVFSGKTFAQDKATNSLKDFDFSSLINVDPTALSQMLNIDPSAFKVDLGSLNLSSLGKNVSNLQLPPPDLMSLFGNLNIQVSPQALTSLLTQTVGDYLADVLPGGLLPPVVPTTTTTSTTSSAPPVTTTSSAATTPPPPTPTGPSTTGPPSSTTPPSSPPVTTSATPVPTPSSPTPSTTAAPSTSTATTAPATPVPPTTPATVPPATTVPPSTATATPAVPSPTPALAAALTLFGLPAAPVPTSAPASTATAGPGTPAAVPQAGVPTTAPTTPAPATSVPTPAAPVLPTSLPSDLASYLPSNLASYLPTNLPSNLASYLPTSLPSNLASYLPTNLPSVLPTSLPSIPTVNDVVDSFTTWFARPDVQATFAARLAQTIDMTAIEKQLATSLTSYMQKSMQTVLTSMMGSLQTQLTLALQTTMTQMTDQLSSALTMDPSKVASMFSFTMDPNQITSLLMSMASNQANSLESNLRLLGYADPATPSSISIYPKDFAAKQQVLNILDAYNTRMSQTGQDDKVITYTDIVGTLMNSVTTIVNRISQVLVAFVSISLVVSSIMIGVITYISVLERRKEIGILRALGASKRDIGNVFNAETLIIGFVAGMMGVLITLGLTMIANPIFNHLYNLDRIARLPLGAALALIGVSMVLTFVAGLIPSSAASRRDPVEALRSE